MALLSGVRLPSPQGTHLVDRTPALDAYTVWSLPYQIDTVSLFADQVLTDTQPVDELKRTPVGARLPGFGDDWYGRVHLLPARLLLGNLLSSQERTIELWNAHFTPQTLSALEATGTEGLTLTEPVPPPTDFGALESRLYTLAVTLSGPPTIAATYTFTFPSQALVLSVTGARVVVFAFAPNWDEPVVERLSWLTEVIASRDATEQRRGLRSRPRSRLEYQVIAKNHRGAFLDAILFDWQSRVFALPRWTDPQRLAVVLPAGSSTIPATTPHYGFRAEGLAVLVRDPQTCETVEIASVEANQLSLKLPTQNAWEAGTRLFPAELARLEDAVNLSRITAGIKRMQMAFELAEPPLIAAQESSTLHEAIPVYLEAPNRAAALSQDYTRMREDLDALTGVVSVDDAPQRSFGGREMERVLTDRAQVQAFRGWLSARMGRLNRYFQPSWQNDLTLLEPVSSGQTSLTIRDIGAALYHRGQPGRDHLAIWMTSGDWIFRRVIGVAKGETGREVVSLESAIGINASPSDFRLICYMALSRLDADQVELQWLTAGVARARWVAREVTT